MRKSYFETGRVSRWVRVSLTVSRVKHPMGPQSLSDYHFCKLKIQWWVR